MDKRVAKSKAKKDRLLKVFVYPEISLHNNPAELAARRRVRKHDISFGPRTPSFSSFALWGGRISVPPRFIEKILEFLNYTC